MIVFGTLKVGNEAGNILFTGNPDQCREYVGTLNRSVFYELSVCHDNGIIAERIVNPFNHEKGGEET